MTIGEQINQTVEQLHEAGKRLAAQLPQTPPEAPKHTRRYWQKMDEREVAQDIADCLTLDDQGNIEQTEVEISGNTWNIIPDLKGALAKLPGPQGYDIDVQFNARLATGGVRYEGNECLITYEVEQI